MKKLTYALAMLLAGAAQAATYQLPDLAVQVTPNYGNTTTVVTIYTRDALGNLVYPGKTYRGASHFYYLNECARPDDARYHCDVMQESWVVLTAADHSTATVNITAQFASVLITSGHNYWRQSQLVLSGEVYVP